MASGPLPRVISHAQIVSALTYNELIPAVEWAMRTFSQRDDGNDGRGGEQGGGGAGGGGGGGGGIFPPRTLMRLAEKDGHVFVMPAYSAADDLIVTKIVAAFPLNSVRYNLSSHLSTIIMNDANTGVTKAFLPGEHITAMRTAAASAVATKYLAKEGSSILAILGAGKQADAHITALQQVMTSSETRVWTRRFDQAEALAERHGAKACRTAEEAVAGADVIAACTSAKTPILHADWLKPGVHINGVGGSVPWAQQLSSDVMQGAVVYADTMEGAYRESGDIIHSKVDIFGELGDVISGVTKARKEETTVFECQGLALEDAVACRLIYDKVVDKELYGESIGVTDARV